MQWSIFGLQVKKTNWKPDKKFLHEWIKVEVTMLAMNVDWIIEVFNGTGDKCQGVGLKNIKSLVVWQLLCCLVRKGVGS